MSGNDTDFLAPAITPSMRAALQDLHLAQLAVVHAGTRTYDLAPKIRAIALTHLLEEVRPLR